MLLPGGVWLCFHFVGMQKFLSRGSGRPLGTGFPTTVLCHFAAFHSLKFPQVLLDMELGQAQTSASTAKAWFFLVFCLQRKHLIKISAHISWYQHSPEMPLHSAVFRRDTSLSKVTQMFMKDKNHNFDMKDSSKESLTVPRHLCCIQFSPWIWCILAGEWEEVFPYKSSSPYKASSTSSAFFREESNHCWDSRAIRMEQGVTYHPPYGSAQGSRANQYID